MTFRAQTHGRFNPAQEALRNETRECVWALTSCVWALTPNPHTVEFAGFVESAMWLGRFNPAQEALRNEMLDRDNPKKVYWDSAEDAPQV